MVCESDGGSLLLLHPDVVCLAPKCSANSILSGMALKLVQTARLNLLGADTLKTKGSATYQAVGQFNGTGPDVVVGHASIADQRSLF